MEKELLKSCKLETFYNGENIILQARTETGSGSMTVDEVYDGIQIIYYAK